MNEKDIRPAHLLNEYLRLAAQDVDVFFDSSPRVDIPCPGCGLLNSDFAFSKNGFDLRNCRECSSLFQSPRPELSQFGRFYEDSPSSNYWANVFFPSVAESRRELIFAPRVKRIAKFLEEKRFQARTVLEVGAGFGIFLEEWLKLFPSIGARAVEPNRKMAEVCRRKGITTLEAMAETAEVWFGQADLVTCFEVIEHAHDPLTFIQSLTRLARPGGYVVITGLGGDGFDIQTLGKESKAVSPPHHLNFLSKRGFERLLARAGLGEIELQTPGKLDVDIVRNALRENPDLPVPKFVRVLIERGDEAIGDFQAFLSKHCLSSHVWAIGKRPG